MSGDSRLVAGAFADRAGSGPWWSQASRAGVTAKLQELGPDPQTRHHQKGLSRPVSQADMDTIG